jgi:hypothetical protein
LLADRDIDEGVADHELLSGAARGVDMPIGTYKEPEGFCSVHSSKGQDSQPSDVLARLRALPKREGSDDLGDRHRCPYCAYIRGYLDALDKLSNNANAALVKELRKKL